MRSAFCFKRLFPYFLDTEPNERNGRLRRWFVSKELIFNVLLKNTALRDFISLFFLPKQHNFYKEMSIDLSRKEMSDMNFFTAD